MVMHEVEKCSLGWDASPWAAYRPATPEAVRSTDTNSLRSRAACICGSHGLRAAQGAAAKRSHYREQLLFVRLRCLRSFVVNSAPSVASSLPKSPRREKRGGGDHQRQPRDEVSYPAVNSAILEETHVLHDHSLLEQRRPDKHAAVRIDEPADAGIRRAREIPSLFDRPHRR